MELAIVGLGRMGGNMARRLHKAGHRVVAYNRSRDKTEEIIGEGLEGGFAPADVVEMVGELDLAGMCGGEMQEADIDAAGLAGLQALVEPLPRAPEGGAREEVLAEHPPQIALRKRQPE